jgi:hypothetical protein
MSMSQEHLERRGDVDTLRQIAIDVAVIKTKMEALECHVKDSDDMFKDIYSKLSKYDIVLGKAGLVVTAVLFFLTIIFTNLGTIVRDLIHKI